VLTIDGFINLMIYGHLIVLCCNFELLK